MNVRSSGFGAPQAGWRARAVLAVVAVVATVAAVALAGAGGAAGAAGKGAAIKPSFNAYFPTDFHDAAYQQGAVSKVSKKWMVPGGRLPARGAKTVVQSTIARDGSLAAVVVTMKSGSKEWDDAALAAVTKGAPFGTLPAAYPQATMEVHWHFSAN